jgi:hypothetical protein
MAITVSTRPSEFGPAYRPLNYSMTTDLHPNTADLSGTISQIRGVQQIDQGVYDTFVKGELMVIFSNSVPVTSVFPIGQYVTISGTTAGTYDGLQRVKRSQFNRIVLEVTITTDDTGGTCVKHYKNLSLVVQLYIAGSISSPLLEWSKKQNFENAFNIDVSTYMQAEVSGSLVALTSSAINVTDTIHNQSYYIAYAESYLKPKSDGTLSAFVSPFTVDSANTKYAFHIANQYKKTRNGVVEYNLTEGLTPFLINAPKTPVRFLTNQPKTILIGRNDSAQLGYISDTDIRGGSYARIISTYNSSGALIASTSTSADPQTKVGENFGIGPTNLGVGIITASTVKYTVHIDALGTDITETLTYNIDDGCHRQSKRFYFLNEWGEYDSFTFIGNESTNSSVKKTTTERLISPVAVLPETNIVTAQVDESKTHSISSGYVSKETVEWLREILTSTQVYTVEDGLAAYVPVFIPQQSAPISNSNDSLFNFTMKYRYGYNQIRQRG